ncbi:MAG TPA: hypothetical protein PK590_04515, partial [Candidatus Omnitrophota bacterium]|nr:hypothetical protein [Candidatus Omnitrophota bacterium]
AQNKDAFIHELLVPNTRLAAGQYEAAAMRLDRVHQERLRLFAYLNAGFGASLEDLGAWTFVVNGGVGFDIPLLSFTRSAAKYSAEAAKERADSHLLDLETRTHFELKVLLDRLVTMKGQIAGQEKRVQTAQELLAKRVVEVRKRLKERKVAVDAETDRILTALSKGETDELARLVPALVQVSADQRLEEKSWEALAGAANELVKEKTSLSAMIDNRVKVQLLVKRLATPDFRPIPSENALEQADEQFTRDAYQAQLKRVTNPYFRFLDENGGFLESAAKDLTAMEGVLSGFLPEMKKAADSAWAKHPEFKRMKKASDVEKEGLIAEKKLALEERRVALAGKRKQLDAEKPGEKEDKKTQREWRKKLNELQKEQQKLDEELLELGKVESLIRTYKLFQDSQKKLQELVKAANGKSTEDQRHAMRDLLGGLVDGTESYLTSEYLLAKMLDLGAYESRDEWYQGIQWILEFIGDEGTSVFGYTGRIEAIQAAFVNVEKAWAVMKAELDIYVGVGYQRSIVQPETGEATTGSVFTLGFGGVFNHLKRAILGPRSGAQQTAAQLLAESSRAIIERARAHAQESKETWGIQSEMGKLTARIKLYEKIKEEFQQWRSSYEPRPDGVRTHVDRLRSLLVNDRATDEIYSLKTADLDARIQSDTAAIQYLESQLKRLGFSPDAIRQGTAYNEGLQTETTALAPIDEQLREMSRESYSRQSATLNSMLDSVLARSTMGPSAYVTSASMAQSPFYRDAGVFYQSLDADAGLPGADSNRFAVFSWNGADLFGSQKQIYTLMLRHTRSLEDSAVKENERVIQSQVRSVVSAASRLRVLNRMNKLLSDQVSGLQKLEAMIGASRYEHGIKARSYGALETIALHESEDAFAANLIALWTEVKGMSVGEGEKKKIFHDRLATLRKVEETRLAEDLDSLKTKAGQLGISFDLVEGLDLTKVGNLENYESDEAVRARVREEINEQFAKILDQNRLQFSVKFGLSHPSRQSELSKGEPFLGFGASYLIYDSNLQAMMNFWENRGSIEQLWAKQGDQDDKARWVELGLDVQKLQKEVELRRDVVEAVATAYRIARERARRDGYPDAPIDAAFRYMNELKAYKGAADAYWEASQRMIDFAREKGIKIELPRGTKDSIDRIKAMIPQWIEDDTTGDVTAPKYLEETVKPELTGQGDRAPGFSIDDESTYPELKAPATELMKVLDADSANQSQTKKDELAETERESQLLEDQAKEIKRGIEAANRKVEPIDERKAELMEEKKRQEDNKARLEKELGKERQPVSERGILQRIWDWILRLFQKRSVPIEGTAVSGPIALTAVPGAPNGLQTQIQQAEESIKSIDAQVAQLEREMAGILAEIEDLSNELRAIEQQLADLRERVGVLKRKLDRTIMLLTNMLGRVAERYGRKDPAAWVARVTESYQYLQRSGFFEKTGFMEVGLGEEIWGNLFGQCFSMGPEAHKLLEERGIDMNQLAIAAFMGELNQLAVSRGEEGDSQKIAQAIANDFPEAIAALEEMREQPKGTYSLRSPVQGAEVLTLVLYRALGDDELRNLTFDKILNDKDHRRAIENLSPEFNLNNIFPGIMGVERNKDDWVTGWKEATEFLSIASGLYDAKTQTVKRREIPVGDPEEFAYVMAQNIATILAHPRPGRDATPAQIADYQKMMEQSAYLTARFSHHLANSKNLTIKEEDLTSTTYLRLKALEAKMIAEGKTEVIDPVSGAKVTLEDVKTRKEASRDAEIEGRLMSNALAYVNDILFGSGHDAGENRKEWLAKDLSERVRLTEERVKLEDVFWGEKDLQGYLTELTTRDGKKYKGESPATAMDIYKDKRQVAGSISNMALEVLGETGKTLDRESLAYMSKLETEIAELQARIENSETSEADKLSAQASLKGKEFTLERFNHAKAKKEADYKVFMGQSGGKDGKTWTKNDRIQSVIEMRRIMSSLRTSVEGLYGSLDTSDPRDSGILRTLAEFVYGDVQSGYMPSALGFDDPEEWEKWQAMSIEERLTVLTDRLQIAGNLNRSLQKAGISLDLKDTHVTNLGEKGEDVGLLMSIAFDLQKDSDAWVEFFDKSGELAGNTDETRQTARTRVNRLFGLILSPAGRAIIQEYLGGPGS